VKIIPVNSKNDELNEKSSFTRNNKEHYTAWRGYSKHLKRVKNRLPAGTPPPLGSLQRSPDSLAGGEGAGCTLPKNPTPALGHAGLAQTSALRFLHLDRKILATTLSTPGLNIFLRLWLSAHLKAIANSTTSTIAHVRQLTALEETGLSRQVFMGSRITASWLLVKFSLSKRHYFRYSVCTI